MNLIKIDEKIEIAKKAIKEKKDTYVYEDRTYKITLFQRLCIFMYCNIFCAICTYLIFGIEKLHMIIIWGSILFFILPLLLFELNSKNNILS